MGYVYIPFLVTYIKLQVISIKYYYFVFHVKKEEELLEEEFPDTKVDLKIDGDKVRTRLTSVGENGQMIQDDDEESNEFFVTSAPQTTINSSVQKLKNKQKKAGKLEKTQQKNKKPEKVQVPGIPEEPTDVAQRPKRGQHGRKKKLKEKYKFQDDEERQLRMQLLRVIKIRFLICLQ